jgi:hypothetical protein
MVTRINTSLICEIAYGAEPSATLYPHNDEDDSVEMETIKAMYLLKKQYKYSNKFQINYLV